MNKGKADHDRKLPNDLFIYLERGENPLEQKEAIQAFMRNNEAVARYFEQHSTVIN